MQNNEEKGFFCQFCCIFLSSISGKGKKKKSEVARSQLPVPFNESLCYAALKTLDVLFNSLGFTLTPEIHKVSYIFNFQSVAKKQIPSFRTFS